jgi:outer membrane protein assembly factor BamD
MDRSRPVPTTFMYNMKIWLLILCLFCTFSCAKEKKVSSAENSYIEALAKLKDKDYTAAAESFEKISDEFPLSKWGVKAQTMAAYSFYKEEKYSDVVRIAEDFNRNNPSNPDVAYMQYLKSISYYNQINDIERAQDNASAASYSFRELIARFPMSEYSDDARDKLSLVDEHIAGAKMSVGRYQLQTANYIGAIKNFQEVMDRYARTNQASEAYFRTFEAYKKIGLNQEAKNYLQELNDIYPDNKWSNKSH